MPNPNEKTDHSPTELRDFAIRIHSCASQFEIAADAVEKTDGKSIQLAIDSFLSTLHRLESFKRTLDRETAAIKTKEMATKAKERVAAARKKKKQA